MRLILATTVAVAAMVMSVGAQPQCSGMAFDKACTPAPGPKLRATFGAPLAPAVIQTTPKAKPPVAEQFFSDGAWTAARASASAVASTPAIDCAMLKHTGFPGDTKMIHVAAPGGGARVISVPSCANPATSGPKK